MASESDCLNEKENALSSLKISFLSLERHFSSKSPPISQFPGHSQVSVRQEIPRLQSGGVFSGETRSVTFIVQ